MTGATDADTHGDGDDEAEPAPPKTVSVQWAQHLSLIEVTLENCFLSLESVHSQTWSPWLNILKNFFPLLHKKKD